MRLSKLMSFVMMAGVLVTSAASNATVNDGRYGRPPCNEQLGVPRAGKTAYVPPATRGESTAVKKATNHPTVSKQGKK